MPMPVAPQTEELEEALSLQVELSGMRVLFFVLFCFVFLFFC